MLYPDYYSESIYMIPYQELKQRNISALIFDVDNTLAPVDMARPPAKVSALIRRLKRMGFKVCLVSNNTGKRMGIFNESLGLTAVHGAWKPLTKGIRRAMQEMAVTPGETAIIGDQLFSDIWAGKNAGITTVLVKPLSDRDFVTVRIKRLFERPILKAYFKRTGTKM